MSPGFNRQVRGMCVCAVAGRVVLGLLVSTSQSRILRFSDKIARLFRFFQELGRTTGMHPDLGLSLQFLSHLGLGDPGALRPILKTLHPMPSKSYR